MCFLGMSHDLASVLAQGRWPVPVRFRSYHTTDVQRRQADRVGLGGWAVPGLASGEVVHMRREHRPETGMATDRLVEASDHSLDAGASDLGAAGCESAMPCQCCLRAHFKLAFPLGVAFVPTHRGLRKDALEDDEEHCERRCHQHAERSRVRGAAADEG